jgi:hypothetical protein
VADELDREDGSLPPATEEIHLPSPSYLPPVIGFGTMIALIGVVLNVVVVALGLILVVVPLVIWIRKTRAEMAELPLEHP